jgi:hypothetical protein
MNTPDDSSQCQAPQTSACARGAQTSNLVTGVATVSAVTSSSMVDPMANKAGNVVLRGFTVALDTDLGTEFIIDCTRHTEGLLSDSDIKSKWSLNENDWAGLANNTELLEAVRRERERRIYNGDAVREAAQQHFAKAPTVLGGILANEQVSPRHRIEAARELRQVAGNGPDMAPNAGERFIISINLGADERLHYDLAMAPNGPQPADDGEAS